MSSYGFKNQTRTISDSPVTVESICELADGSIVFIYRTDTNDGYISIFKPDGSKIEQIIGTDLKAIKAVNYDDSTLVLAWVERFSARYCKVGMNGAFTASSVYSVAVTDLSSNSIGFELFMLKDSTICISQMDYLDTRDLFSISKSGDVVTTENYGYGALSNIKQHPNGDLYGYNEMYKELQRYSISGSLINGVAIDSAHSATFDFEVDGSILLVAEYYEWGATSSSLYHINQTLYSYNRVPLDPEIKNPKIVPIEENNFGLVYINRNSSYVWYNRIGKSEEKPRLILKRIDEDRACLINRTGRSLELSLSATKGRLY